jgi:hypothetical protein
MIPKTVIECTEHIIRCDCKTCKYNIPPLQERTESCVYRIILQNAENVKRRILRRQN